MSKALIFIIFTFYNESCRLKIYVCFANAIILLSEWGGLSECPWGEELKGGYEDSPWCRWWWHKPGPPWCPCRSHICSSSTHSQSGRPVPRRWKQKHTQWPSATLSPLFIITLLWSHPFIKVRDDDGRDAPYHYMIDTHQLLVQRGRTGYTELRYFSVWTMSPFFRFPPPFSPRELISHL